MSEGENWWRKSVEKALGSRALRRRSKDRLLVRRGLKVILFLKINCSMCLKWTRNKINQQAPHGWKKSKNNWLHYHYSFSVSLPNGTSTYPWNGSLSSFRPKMTGHGPSKVHFVGSTIIFRFAELHFLQQMRRRIDAKTVSAFQVFRVRSCGEVRQGSTALPKNLIFVSLYISFFGYTASYAVLRRVDTHRKSPLWIPQYQYVRMNTSMQCNGSVWTDFMQ